MLHSLHQRLQAATGFSGKNCTPLPIWSRHTKQKTFLWRMASSLDQHPFFCWNPFFLSKYLGTAFSWYHDELWMRIQCLWKVPSWMKVFVGCYLASCSDPSWRQDWEFVLCRSQCRAEWRVRGVAMTVEAVEQILLKESSNSYGIMAPLNKTVGSPPSVSITDAFCLSPKRSVTSMTLTILTMTVGESTHNAWLVAKKNLIYLAAEVTRCCTSSFLQRFIVYDCY